METKARKYIEEAVRRIDSGVVESEEGSHVAGVFGKAAQLYEQRMRDKLREVLDGCGIDFDRELRPEVNGRPAFSKLTLGMIAFCFKRVAHTSNSCLRWHFGASTSFAKFHQRLDVINKRWIDVKHGGGIDAPEAVRQLKNMIATLDSLAT